MSNEEVDIVFQLYKLSSTILPENNSRSIDEIFKYLYPNSNLRKSELFDRLKETLKKLEEKQAIILMDGFKSISLIEPKLSELVYVSK
jgi:hypothetical protein